MNCIPNPASAIMEAQRVGLLVRLGSRDSVEDSISCVSRDSPRSTCGGWNGGFLYCALFSRVASLPHWQTTVGRT